MKHHYKMILHATEEKVTAILKKQIMDKSSSDYGSIMNLQAFFSDPPYTIFCIKDLLSVFYNEDSFYYNDKKLYNRIILTLDYLDRIQRPDGTFDGITTNFYSAPETGFGMHSLALCWRMVEIYGAGYEKDVLQFRLHRLIETSGEGIASGGFHTPNHRWVEASALLQAYRITGVEAFRTAVYDYLAEGIDCNEDGEFAERSAGIYNATNDNSLIILTEETGDDRYLGYVKKNLDMMFAYFEPDGSIFTMNSKRQDKSLDKKIYPTAYYTSYLYMAFRYGYKEYTAILNNIMDAAVRGKADFPDCLDVYMVKPEYKGFYLDEKPIEPTFERFFKKSGIARVGRKGYTWSLVRNNSCFLIFQTQNIRCRVKMCASFFAVAQFKAEDITWKNNAYIMKFKTYGYYRMPYEQPPVAEDYWQMDYSSRPLAKKLELAMMVSVCEIEDGISVNVVVSGCDRVPFKLEFCFTPGLSVHGDSFMLKGDEGRNITVKSGAVKVLDEMDAIVLGPAFADHSYACDMRGSEPTSENEFTVYFTGFTPLDRTFTIVRSI